MPFGADNSKDDLIKRVCHFMISKHDEIADQILALSQEENQMIYNSICERAIISNFMLSFLFVRQVLCAQFLSVQARVNS